MHFQNWKNSINGILLVLIFSLEILLLKKTHLKWVNDNTGQLDINFQSSTINQIDDNAFNGIQKGKTLLGFVDVNPGFDYLPEATFKPFLDQHPTNKITISYNNHRQFGTTDCQNCKNQWLIRDNRKSQVEVKCSTPYDKSLFDEDIQTKLNQKCSK